MKQPSKGIKILKTSLSALFYIIIGLLLLFAIATISKKREDEVPSLFGIGMLTVQTDSMEGTEKDSFFEGDLLFVRVVTKRNKDKIDMEELANSRKVISFYESDLRGLNSHRAIDYVKTGNSEFLRTKGDKYEEDERLIYRDDIKAIYIGKIKGAGKVVDFMQSMLGFGLIVMLPMLILLVWQGYLVIKNVFDAKQQKLEEEIALTAKETVISDEERKRIEEEERERIRQELLEELKKENKEDQ